VYLAAIQVGRSGGWLFEVLQTAEPAAGLFLYEFYIFLGHLSRWLNLPALTTFHLARSLAGLWALLAAWDYFRARRAKKDMIK